MTSPAKFFEFFLEIIALAIPRLTAISKEESGAMYPTKKNQELQKNYVHYMYKHILYIHLCFVAIEFIHPKLELL